MSVRTLQTVAKVKLLLLSFLNEWCRFSNKSDVSTLPCLNRKKHRYSSDFANVTKWQDQCTPQVRARGSLTRPNSCWPFFTSVFKILREHLVFRVFPYIYERNKRKRIGEGTMCFLKQLCPHMIVQNSCVHLHVSSSQWLTTEGSTLNMDAVLYIWEVGK